MVHCESGEFGESGEFDASGEANCFGVTRLGLWNLKV